jgi:hypothetical protein
VIYAKQLRKGEPFYPFILSLNVSQSDSREFLKPKDYGYTYSCENCHGELQNQWSIYEGDRIPQNKRKYKEQIDRLCQNSDSEDIGKYSKKT